MCVQNVYLKVKTHIAIYLRRIADLYKKKEAVRLSKVFVPLVVQAELSCSLGTQ